MNVKQGDMAVIVGGDYAELRDRFVEVVRPSAHGEIFVSTTGTKFFTNCEKFPNEPIWVIKASTPLPWGDAPQGPQLFVERPIWDKGLRPIRHPGDDAVDETIQRLGKPKGVKHAA